MLSRTGELGKKLKEVPCLAYSDSTKIRIILVGLWVIINIIIITSTTSEDDRKRQDTAYLSPIL